MGKGIAKEFKRIYPEMFREYQRACELRRFDIGDLFLYKTSNKWILNFPTKRHWRSPSKPEYIEAGLQKFNEMFQEARITSISFPMLGCGNGELDWQKQVHPLMKEFLKGLPIQVFIHVAQVQSNGQSEHLDPNETKRWLRSQPQSLGFTEVWDDLVSVLRKKAQFTTFDGQINYSAHLTDGDDDDDLLLINIAHQSEQIKIDADQLSLDVPDRLIHGLPILCP
jgi:hypothetical protein